jgi:hypothetical protein
VEVVLWALGTGGITGAVWVAIVLFGRQRRLAAEHRELLEDRQRVLDHLDGVQRRVLDLEDRLDFTERRLRSGEGSSPPAAIHPAESSLPRRRSP